MDWSTGDYTSVYGDTFYLPESHGSVYLLDEAERGPDPYEPRAPIGRYDYAPRGGDRPCKQSGYLSTDRAQYYGGREGYSGTPRSSREGFYGNVVSERGDGELARVYNVAWDERPMHYNPNAGTDWAHLVPSRADRPYGGGPAPSLAFPLQTPSEGLNNPQASSWASAPCRGSPAKESFQGQTPTTPTLSSQDVQLFILVIVIILLSVALMDANRQTRSLEKLLKKSFRIGQTNAAGSVGEAPG
jgi:hypothetical protein